MASNEFDFAKIISPIEPEEFFRDVWEKRPLVVSRGSADYYSTLFSPEEIDDLVCFTRPKFGSDGGGATQPAVLRGVAEESWGDPPPGLVKVASRYAKGQTLLIHGVQQRHRAVAALTRNLELTLRHPVNVNLYLTPPSSQGFGPHYDDHDVFVLQIRGSKHWNLYEPERELPLKFDEDTVPKERLRGVRKEVLAAGDLLYLPRGHVHEAFAASEASLHLTVGVDVFRWADLLASALACASRNDVRLRRALPVGMLASTGDAAAQRGHLRELLQIVCEQFSSDDAFAHLSTQFVNRLPAIPNGLFARPLDVESIGLDTPLSRAPGTICQVVEDGASVSIHFPGNHVRGPAHIATAVRFIVTAPPGFTARALPGSLSDSAKLTLVRRLLVERLLVCHGT